MWLQNAHFFGLCILEIDIKLLTGKICEIICNDMRVYLSINFLNAFLIAKLNSNKYKLGIANTSGNTTYADTTICEEEVRVYRRSAWDWPNEDNSDREFFILDTKTTQVSI